MNRTNTWIVIIVALAAFVRLWGTFDYPDYFYDESIHIPAAISIGQYGTAANSDWAHPPLAGLLRCVAISLVGNNPYGWRSVNVLFGTATIVLIYLVGRKLFVHGHAPLLATVVLALDPFHACFSRTTFTEIIATFFFLLFIYFMLGTFEGRRNNLILAGIALGLTMATKGGYFICSALFLVGYACFKARMDGERTRRIVTIYFIMMVLLPTAIYLLSFFPWFSRGYSFVEFIQMRLDAFWVLNNLHESSFPAIETLKLGGKPWEWFIKPIIFGHRMAGEGGFDRFMLEINNPPIRILAIPSAVYVVYLGWKKRSFQEMIPSLLFCTGYLLFLVVDRPIFSYSSLVLLPFAYLCVARMIEQFAQWSGKEKQVYSLVIFFVVSWGLYTFPIYSFTPVPVAIYRPILSIAKFVGMN
jgi:dolichyl-phosphate-mannose-protein mannosyltransferase